MAQQHTYLVTKIKDVCYYNDLGKDFVGQIFLGVGTQKAATWQAVLDIAGSDALVSYDDEYAEGDI